MDFSALTGVAFKAVAIILSILYLVYSLVVSKQIQIMGKTVEGKTNPFLVAVSSLQTAVALLLLIFSIFLV